ncbi:MmgE/PrpD family protein [Cupriavidus sp. D384]|uniref:MmgE/PrpD family protein n=1 Tax=Cupriavidus sp. D384 TaxID=1538095 RepID=UPI0009EE0907|nr:MmgE/PrpD family protein [Cupriavidus sp. D384]
MKNPHFGPNDSLSLRIAEWVQRIDIGQAPEPVRQALSACLLYNLTMGLAVNPGDDELGAILATVASSPGDSRLLNGWSPRSAQDAAFINAALITARGQNDTHPEVVTHIGCVVIPAVLALADECVSSLEDVLSAILAGYEVIPRLAKGLARQSGERGFRATPVFGPIGAAVACARLLRLSVLETANALSIATQYSSGTLQTWIDGSHEWRLQVAKASRDAVSATLLARAGMQGSAGCLEGENGFARAYSGGYPNFDFTGWRILEMAYKPYPGCAFNQGPVHALREVFRRSDVAPEKVTQINVHLHPSDAGYPGIRAYGPFSSPAGAIMSLPFMLAATLRDGLPRTQHFNKEFDCGSLHELCLCIRVHASDNLDRWHCSIDAHFDDGTVQTQLFAPPHPFVFDWQEIQALTQRLSNEWPVNRDHGKYPALAQAVERLDNCDSYERFSSAIFCMNRSTLSPE